MISINGFPVYPTEFPDKTSQVWKLDMSKLKDGITITWEFESEAEFMHLAQLKHLLDASAITPSKLDIKFLPYARQDKDVDNVSTFALIPFARLLNALEFDAISILDPHSSRATELIKNSYDYYPKDEWAKAWTLTQSNIICYPDNGAFSKYLPHINHPQTLAKKKRNQLTGEITGMFLPSPQAIKNKKVLIIDDICDAGRTFTELSKLLYEAGAVEVNMFVTYGLFSKGLQVLLDAGIKNIYTADGLVTPHAHMSEAINYTPWEKL